MISGLVHTKNAGRTLEWCLASMRDLTDELVVVDMCSVDDSVEIAIAAGARVVHVPDYGYVEPARPAGTAACLGEWIFNLDADEIAHPALLPLLAQVARSESFDGVHIPFRNYLLGHEMRGSGWGPSQDGHLRFYRKSVVHHSSTVHAPSLVRSDRTLTLEWDGPSILHFNYAGFDEFISKLNRYTDLEAAAESKHSLFRTVCRATREFVRRYFWHRGYRDGLAGLYLSLAMAFYRLAVGAKRWQLDSAGSTDDIWERYSEVASDLLSGSP